MRGRERQTRKRGSQGHRQRQTAKAQAPRTMLLIISNVFRTEREGKGESRERQARCGQFPQNKDEKRDAALCLCSLLLDLQLKLALTGRRRRRRNSVTVIIFFHLLLLLLNQI